MYLHLGQDCMVHSAELIGLFDLDTTTISKKTREFLARAEKAGRVVNTSQELPKSFALMADARQTVFLSQISAATLKRRARNFFGEGPPMKRGKKG